MLEELEVSSPKLKLLLDAALKNGSFGAKLSGAGGGDCIIVLYPLSKKQRIIDAMIANGGQIIDI